MRAGAGRVVLGVDFPYRDRLALLRPVDVLPLRRGCAACYAAEGIYPQDLEYLEEHYGVQVDGDRYVVHYEIFAQNLMPDITVLENKP